MVTGPSRLDIVLQLSFAGEARSATGRRTRRTARPASLPAGARPLVVTAARLPGAASLASGARVRRARTARARVAPSRTAAALAASAARVTAGGVPAAAGSGAPALATSAAVAALASTTTAASTPLRTTALGTTSLGPAALCTTATSGFGGCACRSGHAVGALADQLVDGCRRCVDSDGCHLDLGLAQ